MIFHIMAYAFQSLLGQGQIFIILLRKLYLLLEKKNVRIPFQQIAKLAVYKSRCHINKNKGGDQRKLQEKSNTPMQASGYLTLAAVAKWPCKHARLARCSQE